MFGGIAIPVAHLAIEERWHAIAPFNPGVLFGSSCDGDKALCGSGIMHVWQRLQKTLASNPNPQLETLQQVNTEVNAALRYRTNTDNYGVPDYWASPEQIARRGSADCKEFAITKMWMLSALHVPASAMRIVVVKDTRRALGHAILDVELNGEHLILDNVTSQILPDRVHHLVPTSLFCQHGRQLDLRNASANGISSSSGRNEAYVAARQG